MAKRPKFTIPDDWDAALKRISKKTGILEAELHRRALKTLLESYGETVEGEIQHGGKRTPSQEKDNNDEPTAQD